MYLQRHRTSNRISFPSKANRITMKMCSNQIEIRIHTFTDRHKAKWQTFQLTWSKVGFETDGEQHISSIEIKKEKKIPTTNCHKIRYCQPSIWSRVTLQRSFRLVFPLCVLQGGSSEWVVAASEGQILLPCAYLIELSSECKLLLCRKSGWVEGACGSNSVCVELFLPKVYHNITTTIRLLLVHCSKEKISQT